MKLWIIFCSCMLLFCGSDGATSELPWKTGEVFVVENYDFKVTKQDLGCNFFCGNTGELNIPDAGAGQDPITSVSISTNSFNSDGGSLKISFDFNSYGLDSVGGLFMSLFGLTDTLVSTNGSGIEPTNTTKFADYYLDFNNVYGDFLLWQDRSIDQLAFDIQLQPGSLPVKLKIELRDENNFDVFTRILVPDGSWQTAELARNAFSMSVTGNNNTTPFLWDKVSTLSLVAERFHAADNVDNPNQCGIMLDNIRLVDMDGLYPDLESARDPISGGLKPEYKDAFLDHIRKLSFLYFLDFASTDERTGGMIQDRGSFADLMSVGGAGFQLSAYAIGAERGYLSRTNAADRVHGLLHVMDTHPQGTNRVGTIGHKGFFYHFMGIDGNRKQNFDFTKTEDLNEAMDTVELSSIDTALVLMGVITAGQYFNGDNPQESDIRSMSDRIVRRVDWPFMTATLSEGKQQAYLGWKPLENRDDSGARFLLPDADGTGHYSSHLDGEGVEHPSTLDYYTDEGLMIALLAMAAPETSNRLSHTIWDDLIRSKKNGIAATYPGALFTYQFLSCWVDTEAMGTDNHATEPVDFYANTETVIKAVQQYAISNALEITSYGTNAWALTACDGPFDSYFAEGAHCVALADDEIVRNPNLDRTLQGEDSDGDGTDIERGNATGGWTRYLTTNTQSITWSFDIIGNGFFRMDMRYSNDGPSDEVQLLVDGISIGTVTTTNTFPSGGTPGDGWNNFATNTFEHAYWLDSTTHTAQLVIVDTDYYGVEVDQVEFIGSHIKTLNSGILAPYGAGGSILHAPGAATDALWHMAMLDLNQDGTGDLLHPRFGFADAYNEEIADAAIEGLHDLDDSILRISGAWINPVGFSIDQGPMLLILDNYLGDQFIPSLFMNDPDIHRAMVEIFAQSPDIYSFHRNADGSIRMKWKGAKYATVEATSDLESGSWVSRCGMIATNQQDVSTDFDNTLFLRARQVE